MSTSGLNLTPDFVPESKQRKLLSEAFMMEEQDAQDAGAIGYMARALVQATIPHRDPGDVPAYGRRNGDMTLLIRPGYTLDEHNNPVSIGFPYGVIPRLLLAWITTVAVRTGERRIHLGNSLSMFMSELGLDPTGGRNGTITRLKEQMRRLFAATLSINYSTKDVWSEGGFRISDTATIFWDTKEPAQAGLWDSHLVLSETFFSEIIQRPVPLDLRAICTLRQSPLALDLYCWLTYRMFYLRRPTPISWESLRMQFGSDYKEVRQFKRRFLDALRLVNVVYPVKAVPTVDFLELHPGPTHVRRVASP